MRVFTPMLAVLTAFVTACGANPQTETQSQATVVPVLTPGNPTCEDLGYAEEFKIDQSLIQAGGWHTYSDGELEVMVYTLDRKHFAWSANIGIDAVLVKASPAANVYIYDPESLGDSGLVTPTNSSGSPADISHLTFCYDWEVFVTKTADTRFTRSYTWQIQKDTAADPNLLLALGQSYSMPYVVSVSSSHTDSDWAVSGDIQIHNPSTQRTAVLASVSDLVEGGIGAPVDCGVTFPYSLAPQATLTCSYSSPLPDGADRLNTATVTVTTESEVGGNTGTADVTWGDPSSEIDECIDVDDDKAGFLGTTCAPTQFQYSLEIGPYSQCGEHTFLNLATFTTNDTGTQGWDNATVAIDVPCAPDSCTLTPGYWKTHSEFGPAPYDDTWALLSNGASTSFFLSGQTYYEVLWTPPKGNAYYILAHAYIAATLNGLNGADLTDVNTELADAMQFFQTYTPAEIGALRGKGGVRKDAIALAQVLDDYNNGLLGPGHCSEDQTATAVR